MGEAVGGAMIVGHSEEAELRADRNGVTYLWGAGYVVDANLRMLNKLSAIKVQAEERQEPIMSGFINSQYGA